MSDRVGRVEGRKLLLLVVLVSCTAGCGRSAISGFECDRLVLFSIDGRDDRRTSADEELFRGYPVLGKINVKDPADRRKIMAAVAKGIARSDGTMAKCFWPRHAIHAEKNGKSVDYVICFECLQLSINRDDDGRMVPTTREPAAVLNPYLTKAGIPIAPD